MLTGKQDWQEKVRGLPRRQVLLCHTRENLKQKRILERVKEVFRRLGYGVTLLPMDGVV
jgi:hypothetical protein